MKKPEPPENITYTPGCLTCLLLLIIAALGIWLATGCTYDGSVRQEKGFIVDKVDGVLYVGTDTGLYSIDHWPDYDELSRRERVILIHNAVYDRWTGKQVWQYNRVREVIPLCEEYQGPEDLK